MNIRQVLQFAPKIDPLRDSLWPTPTLGWLRVGLAAIVALFHYGITTLMTQRLLGTHPDWREHLVYAGDGNLAVLGFFVISGYLVAQVIQERHDPAKIDHFLRFTFSRYLRLWPLYALLFVVFALACLAGIDPKAVPDDPARILSWFLLLPAGLSAILVQPEPLYLQVVPGFWGAVWTLSMDFLFYPLGFLLMRKPSAVWPLVLSRIAAQITFAVLLPLHAPPVPGYGPALFDSSWNLRYYTTVNSMFFPFVVGMQARLWVAAAPARKARSWLLAACVAALVWLLWFPWGVTPFFASTLCTIVFAVLVAELARNGQAKNKAAMGHFTYGLYLTHQFVGSVFIAPLAAYWIGVRLEGGPIDRWRRRILALPWARFERLSRPMPSAVVFIPFAVAAISVISTALSH